MDKATLVAILSSKEGTAEARIAKALEELAKVGKGNIHLLAQIVGVDSLSDIKVGTTLNFAEMYMKYNTLRPKAKNESADNFKALPQQMWRDQGISFELKNVNGVASFIFTGYDEAKHLKFREKNKAQKEKEKAKAKAEADALKKVA